jgi:hypothetical protein
MGSILTFPFTGTQIEPRVLPYGGWLTDERLSSLGFSANDIRAIRRGKPIGAVLAQRERRSSAGSAGAGSEVQVSRHGW